MDDRSDRLAAHVRGLALELGFVRVGFAPVERLELGGTRMRAWVEMGRGGNMNYLASAGDRADVRALQPDALTVIAVAAPYGPLLAPEGTAHRAGTGEIALYAQGTDYHRVIKAKLRLLADQIAAWLGRPVRARACVDTAPLLEREACARAGLGFIGKSTLLICPGAGSGVLLGELLVDVPIAPGGVERTRCGRCRRCLDACPTGALVEAYQLDARRCIAYLTIEHRGWIPRSLRPSLGRWVFGCDICQQVCPFNASQAARSTPSLFGPARGIAGLPLTDLLELEPGQHRKLTRGTALERVTERQLARNAAVAIGNTGDRAFVPALLRALAHRSGLVRGHVAWALGRLGGSDARTGLTLAAATDRDAQVRDEAELALREASAS